MHKLRSDVSIDQEWKLPSNLQNADKRINMAFLRDSSLRTKLREKLRGQDGNTFATSVAITLDHGPFRRLLFVEG